VKRSSLVVLTVAGLTLAACSSPTVGVNQTATTGAGSQTTSTTKTTAAANPTVGTVSSYMTGTAHPTIPALVPGKVAIIETGPASGTSGATVPVMVGNGTSGTIYFGPPGMNVGDFRDPLLADARAGGRVRSARA
jgi:hypothetical protein